MKDKSELKKRYMIKTPEWMSKQQKIDAALIRAWWSDRQKKPGSFPELDRARARVSRQLVEREVFNRAHGRMRGGVGS